MLFYFDIKNKKRILVKKSKKNELKKRIASFSEPKYLLIFGKLF